MKSSLVRIMRICGFVVAKKMGWVRLPKGSMDGLDFTMFLMETAKNRSVLEFGSGGSTLSMASVCKSLVTVESEKTYIRLIKAASNFSSLQDKIQFHFANIGPVSSYGFPVRFLSRFFRKRYPRYSRDVFVSYPELKNVDIVCIDGRFRVACFLEVLTNVEPPFTIIFDDFYRLEYLALSSLCIPTGSFGKTALFDVRGSIIPPDTLRKLVKQYAYDPR